jgi:hypothetical protein
MANFFNLIDCLYHYVRISPCTLSPKGHKWSEDQFFLRSSRSSAGKATGIEFDSESLEVLIFRSIIFIFEAGETEIVRNITSAKACTDTIHQ